MDPFIPNMLIFKINRSGFINDVARFSNKFLILEWNIESLKNEGEKVDIRRGRVSFELVSGYILYVR